MPFQESRTKCSQGCFSVCLPIAEGVAKSHVLHSLLMTCSARLPFSRGKELRGALRGRLPFIRLLRPLRSVVKGAGSELGTFGSVPEQPAREAYQVTVIGIDLNLSPSHHPFWIRSSLPNNREAALGEAQPSSCYGCWKRKGKVGKSLSLLDLIISIPVLLLRWSCKMTTI